MELSYGGDRVVVRSVGMDLNGPSRNEIRVQTSIELRDVRGRLTEVRNR